MSLRNFAITVASMAMLAGCGDKKEASQTSSVPSVQTQDNTSENQHSFGSVEWIDAQIKTGNARSVEWWHAHEAERTAFLLANCTRYKPDTAPEDYPDIANCVSASIGVSHASLESYAAEQARLEAENEAECDEECEEQ